MPPGLAGRDEDLLLRPRREPDASSSSAATRSPSRSPTHARRCAPSSPRRRSASPTMSSDTKLQDAIDRYLATVLHQPTSRGRSPRRSACSPTSGRLGSAASARSAPASCRPSSSARPNTRASAITSSRRRAPSCAGPCASAFSNSLRCRTSHPPGKKSESRDRLITDAGDGDSLQGRAAPCRSVATPTASSAQSPSTPACGAAR